MKDRLPVGSRIRFTKTLGNGPSEDSPACIYAYAGEHGVVTGHNDYEGHWVKADGWPASFGAVHGDEFEILSEETAPT